MSHEHKADRTETRCYHYPIPGAEENPMAHGNIEDTDYCACGARRSANVNGRHVEQGPWYCPADDEAGMGARS